MKHHLALALLVIFGTAQAQDKVKIAPDRTKTLSTTNGRFVFGQISDFRSDQYMLDTQTGRLWQITESTNDKGNTQRVLQIVPFANLNGILYVLPE
jgi:hypothetical protein